MAIPGEKAIQMVRSAHTQAAQLDIAVTAVVVDQSGRMIALGRMDKARPITVEMALNKAYTAASFQQPTQELTAVAGQSWFQSLVVSSNGRDHAGRRRRWSSKVAASCGAIARCWWHRRTGSECAEVALAAYYWMKWKVRLLWLLEGGSHDGPDVGERSTTSRTAAQSRTAHTLIRNSPTPYLGRSVRIVDKVVNVDMNQSPHPRNSRGSDWAMPLFNFGISNTVSKDPLTRVTAAESFRRSAAFFEQCDQPGRQGQNQSAASRGQRSGGDDAPYQAGRPLHGRGRGRGREGAPVFHVRRRTLCAKAAARTPTRRQ